MAGSPKGAGKSSFDLVDSDLVFSEIGLQPGMSLLDLACGRGDYALKAAGLVGPSGSVFGVDLWEEGIRLLRKEADLRGLDNIETHVAPAGDLSFLKQESIDVCFIATALHDLVHEGVANKALNEIKRILKPDGRFAVVEFKLKEGPPGPPASIRLSPEMTEELVRVYSFSLVRTKETGPETYLSIFTSQADT